MKCNSQPIAYVNMANHSDNLREDAEALTGGYKVPEKGTQTLLIYSVPDTPTATWAWRVISYECVAIAAVAVVVEDETRVESRGWGMLEVIAVCLSTINNQFIIIYVYANHECVQKNAN